MINVRSIRFRLTVWYAVVCAGLFILFGTVMYAVVDHHLQSTYRTAISRRARQLETLLKSTPNASRQWLKDEITSRYTPEANSRFFRITDANGDVVFKSGRPADGSFEADSIPAQKSLPATEVTDVEDLGQGSKMMMDKYPIDIQGRKMLIEVGISMVTIESILDTVLIMLIIGVPVMVIITVAGGYALVRRSLQPVDQIIGTAEQITMHNLSERLPVTRTGDELERLSTALNHMISRLDKSFEYTRRFAADASHELRTPLTIMRGELENVAQKENLPTETRELIGSTLEEIERLAKIAEGLFALSKLDAGQPQSENARFDLGRLVETTADQMCVLAEDKEISICCKKSSDVVVSGDPSRLKQVVVNLIDNAVKYTPKGGSVTVNVEKKGPKAVLSVSDTGIGIPSSAMPHLFERFFRVEKGRSRELGGAGLGLSIVKAIVAAHGGDITVDSAENHGSTFLVSLPLANQQ